MSKHQKHPPAAKERTFYIPAWSKSWQTLICQAGGHEGARNVDLDTWGVWLKCDETTAKRVAALASKMIAAFEPGRLEALVNVLEAHHVAVPGDLRRECNDWQRRTKAGELHELPVEQRRGGKRFQKVDTTP